MRVASVDTPTVARLGASESAIVLDLQLPRRASANLVIVVKDCESPEPLTVRPVASSDTGVSFQIPFSVLVPKPDDPSLADVSIQVRAEYGGKVQPIAFSPELRFQQQIGNRLLVASRTKFGNLTLINARAPGPRPPRPPLNIMIFCSQITFGGGKTKAIMQIARLLRDAGHFTCITALWHPGKDSSHRFPEGVGFDFIDGSYKKSEQPEQPSPLAEVNERATAATERQLRAYLSGSRFDFIYVPNYDSKLYRIFKEHTPRETVLVLGDHNPYRAERILENNPHEEFVWAANNFDGVHVVNPLIGKLVQGLTKRPVFTIPNPAATGQPIDRGTEYFATRRIVSIGRLVKTKRMNHVLQAFAQVASDHPEWSLDIFGTGEQHESLQALIEELGIGNRARLRGFDPEVTSLLQNGALYVSASAAEAHPLTLIEAMATGCLVVSYDRQYGAKYLIKDGVTGFLAKDADLKALASAMHSVMQRIEAKDPGLLDILRRAKDSTAAFSDEAIRKAWDAQVRNMVAAKRALISSL